MSNLSSKTPWRNGYWASPNMPAFIWVVDGEKMDAKNMIALDYPDIEGSMVCTLKHGDFGPPRNSGQPKKVSVSVFHISPLLVFQPIYILWTKKPIEDI